MKKIGISFGGTLSLIGLISTFALLFQNCTPGSFTVASVKTNDTDVQRASAASTDQASSGTGNGHGYDGKPGLYVSQLKAGAKCPDGSDIDSEIQVTPQREAFFVRQNCADIAPKFIDYAQLLSLSSSSQYLIYGGSAFQFSLAVDSSSMTLFVCTNAPQSPALTVVLGMSMTGNYTESFQTGAIDSEKFDAQFTMLGFEMAYVGTDSQADNVTLSIGALRSDGSYAATAKVKFGASRTPAVTDIPSTSMICYRQAR